MTRFIRIALLAGGASLLAGAPVFAQDLNALNPLPGLGGALGIDLDPFHIFTPAPPPAPPAPVAEAPAPRHHHRHRLAHHAVPHRHVHAKAHHVTLKAAKKG